MTPLRIAFVAGEASGDQLGAALIAALRARVPQLTCYGVAGPRMRAAGCEAWASSEELAVMGLTEVLRHLPRLLRLRRTLASRLLRERPDAFVGIDSPEFNLPLAARLKASGIATVQYVSPQVWAWRPGRVRKIARACDLVLCLLPFEPEFYARSGVKAVFVGHPLADQIPLEVDRASARAQLQIGPGPVVALLPGSRIGEIDRLGRDFLAAARYLKARRPELQFVAAMASAAVRERFLAQMATADAPPIRLTDGTVQQVLAAADVVLVTSGTATLETLLSKRPMVVAYRFAAFTHFVLSRLRLVKVPYFSQPNLLAGRALVPELLQQQVTGEALGRAVLGQLEDPGHALQLGAEFRRIHEQRRRDGAALAADSIVRLLGRGAAPGAAERP